MSLIPKLVTEELGFCCMYSFLRASQHLSVRKLNAALGVAPGSLQYWKRKKFAGTLKPCPNCHSARRSIVLSRRADGTPYFPRCPQS